jgi:hypothetical protein
MLRGRQRILLTFWQRDRNSPTTESIESMWRKADENFLYRNYEFARDEYQTILNFLDRTACDDRCKIALLSNLSVLDILIDCHNSSFANGAEDRIRNRLNNIETLRQRNGYNLLNCRAVNIAQNTEIVFLGIMERMYGDQQFSFWLTKLVMPAKAGIQRAKIRLDSRLRGNDDSKMIML